VRWAEAVQRKIDSRFTCAPHSCRLLGVYFLAT
jgi:hypothetical protein